ncbi:glycine cleavage system H-protein subunit [Bachmanniomyces sp. S44760]|nr:glycine cleavage system H-protein subunit [Bachmanniomyces sp. S44760]
MAAIARLNRPLKASGSIVHSSGRRRTLGYLNYRSIPSRASGANFPVSRRGFANSTAQFAKRYTEAHEWIELSEDGKIGTIGISTYAAAALGDVVYVELPTNDQEVSANDAIGAVESVKSASDIYAPVGGKIIEGNSVLEEKPGTVNKGPEGEGWIARIEVRDKAEVEALMDSEAYAQHTDGEAHE